MPAKAPYFDVRGVIEGFYGPYYAFPQRNDLIRFIGRRGFNYYLYAPKNDCEHRNSWREPYPANTLAEFGKTIRIARHNGVNFTYAISFGTPIDFTSIADYQAVVAKFEAMYLLGCRSFAILYDDSPSYFSYGRNATCFQSPGRAHADFANRVFAFIRSQNQSCSFFVCPMNYHGVPPFDPYLRELGSRLAQDVGVFYTGPEICSTSISLENIGSFREEIGRKPVLWDNYPVNDLSMQGELHIGPLCGRNEELYRGLSGYMANLMNQPEASKIPLRTIADYLADPYSYDSESSWHQALWETADQESHYSILRFAENSLGSCLTKELTTLDKLSLDLASDLSQETSAAQALADYLTELDYSIYHLRYRIKSRALCRELLPWLEALKDKVWLGRLSLEVLSNKDISSANLEKQIEKAKSNPKQIGGELIIRLAEHILSQKLSASV